MVKTFKFILTCLLCLLGVGLLYAIFVIVFPWITEYKPEEITMIPTSAPTGEPLESGREYGILTWNIGYAGLGSEMDFFYEGGRMVRPDREQNKRYLEGILGTLGTLDTLDFILLQEVDFRSSRSYKIDQYQAIREQLPGHHSESVVNYRSAYVPSPLADPMGKVDAGMATFSAIAPNQSLRQATPGSYPWPMRLFMLKRCFLISRFPVDIGNELVVINLHNSAFDDAAGLRDQELALLRTLMYREYENGNWVVAGGDWNQNPPGWDFKKGLKYRSRPLWPIEEDFIGPGWTWGFDRALPTNRNVDKPFSLQDTPCTLLDFFAASPNVRINSVRTIDLDFKHSDHQPVIMKFQLIPE